MGWVGGGNRLLWGVYRSAPYPRRPGPRAVLPRHLGRGQQWLLLRLSAGRGGGRPATIRPRRIRPRHQSPAPIPAAGRPRPDAAGYNRILQLRVSARRLLLPGYPPRRSRRTGTAVKPAPWPSPGQAAPAGQARGPFVLLRLLCGVMRRKTTPGLPSLRHPSHFSLAADSY